MSSVASLILLGSAIIAGVGSLTVWAALRRPDRSLHRRRRNEALLAAGRTTPAVRASLYGAAPAPDPCAPGLSDGDRVLAMRALLLGGDTSSADPNRFDATPRIARPVGDDPMTTSPMAWTPTLPPYEAEVWDLKRDTRKPRVRESDCEHITVF